MKKFTNINESTNFNNLYKLVEYKKDQHGNMNESVIAYVFAVDRQNAFDKLNESKINVSDSKNIILLETSDVVMPYIPPVIE